MSDWQQQVRAVAGNGWGVGGGGGGGTASPSWLLALSQDFLQRVKTAASFSRIRQRQLKDGAQDQTLNAKHAS